jgi:hypothetical protein
MSVQNIVLIIDEVVLQGGGGVDRDRFRGQMEQELTRLLQQAGGLPGLAETGGPAAAAPAQTITLAPGQPPGAAQVARAIYGALKG